ncbi:MAG: hypothetical protein EOP92_10840 [Lysobacteraceae bacterium]|nr:MAG: hypothetical protein EOP92_10840 [Xanthomonadaceae bacterium]
MRFFPVLSFFFFYASRAGAAVPACLPYHTTQAMQSEPDGWLLLAGLVVCLAGRLAQRHR